MASRVARALLFLSVVAPLHAAEVSVAVAANFTAPMRRIAQAFEHDTGHKAALAFGSTGNFHAQIHNGAPFDVLLAADDETPATLERDGAGVAGSRFTYATGKLVLWSAQAGLVDGKAQVLRSGGFRRIAVANPKLAPYGAAAMEVLGKLGVLSSLQPKIVQGDNIAQTFQFVATGNAQLGFVALSQVISQAPDAQTPALQTPHSPTRNSPVRFTQGSGWIVPANLYTPIRQDAILLAHGKGNAAATSLLAYLRGEKARAIIRSYGYDP